LCLEAIFNPKPEGTNYESRKFTTFARGNAARERSGMDFN
jgi:hypothetical protein